MAPHKATHAVVATHSRTVAGEEVVREEVDLAAKQRAIEIKLGTFRLRTQRSIARKVAKGEMKLEDVLQMDGDKPDDGEDDDDDDDGDDDDEDGEVNDKDAKGDDSDVQDDAEAKGAIAAAE